MVPGYSMPFSYEELQRQMHMPQAYYDLSFTGRDNLQPGTFQTDQKFGRSDASSPVQTTVNQPQNQHHMQQQQQQAYLNAAATMPPYGFGGLAFYPGGGMMPGGFPTYSAPMYQVHVIFIPLSIHLIIPLFYYFYPFLFSLYPFNYEFIHSFNN